MKLSIHATRLALSALLCASTGIALAQQPERFKFAVFTPDKEQTFLTVMRPFAEAVKKDAAGTCEIDLFPNGALGRSPVQQAQMVLDGVADIAWVIASYTPGRFQENEVLELPGTFRDLREGTLVFTRLVKAGKLRGYDDFYPIGLFATAPYSLHARFAINTIADIRGKKIRASGAVESASLKALGAVPIGMPVTEVAEAVGRGTIDGTTSHPSPLCDFGLDRVTQHDYFTRLGIVPLAILMNAKRYAAAPAACRQAIDKYSGDWTAARFIEGIGAYNDSLVKRLQADSHRTVVFPSAADLAATDAALKPVVTEWAGKSARNAELLAAVQSELAALRAGK